MDNRRTFLKKSAIACAALSVPGCSSDPLAQQASKDFGTKDPQKALVLWYSQTGHTKRYGQQIAHVLEKNNMEVHACDIRFCRDINVQEADLIIAGTPVHYMDVPPNVKEWFKNMAPLDRTAVASYSTFGGPGDNQHNTAFDLLAFMVGKGGVPAGMATFGNMSTYAPTWSMGNEKRTLKYKHLPNKDTYATVSEFAQTVVNRVRQGQAQHPEREFDFMDWMKHLPVIWGSKVLTTDHRIVEEDCIQCGTCTQGCPVGAIDHEAYSIDTDECVLCLGCVNNCPASAINMNYMGKKVVGFPEFCKEQGITILEPNTEDK